MNKIILSLLLTTAIASPATAQNCVNSSRCDELGYTKTAADCTGLDTLICPFDENKVFCTHKKKCQIGDFLYSDKSCYVTAPKGMTPIAVVFSGEHRLAAALIDKYIQWGKGGEISEIDNIETEDINDINDCITSNMANCESNGKDNTAALVAYGDSRGWDDFAAKFCYNYSTEGTKPGDWFLGTASETYLLQQSYTEINNALRSGSYPSLSGKHWTSSVTGIYNPWIHDVTENFSSSSSKTPNYSVRPFIKF